MIFAHPVPGNDRARVIPFCRRLISSYTPPVHRCPQVCNVWLDWMRPKVLCSLKFTCEQTLRHPPSSQSLSESSTQPSCYGTVPSEYGTTLGCIREHSEKAFLNTQPYHCCWRLTTSVARQQPQLGNRCKFFASMYKRGGTRYKMPKLHLLWINSARERKRNNWIGGWSGWGFLS